MTEIEEQYHKCNTNSTGDSDLSNVQSRTEEFTRLFLDLKKQKLPDYEKTLLNILAFYELYKAKIDKQIAIKIIFTELPDFCFEHQVENSCILVKLLHSIHSLLYTAVPHLVLFLSIIGCTYKILLRPKCRKRSMSQLAYFLHHANQCKATFGGKRLTELMQETNPYLFAKLLLFSDSRSVLKLLQYGLRFELPCRNSDLRVHPLFMYSTRLLISFDKGADTLDNFETQYEVNNSARKLSKFVQNFRLLLRSCENPCMVVMLLSEISFVKETSGSCHLKPLLKVILPGMDFENSSPPSLKHLSRYVIRQCMYENWNLPAGIQNLPVPEMYMQYLNLNME